MNDDDSPLNHNSNILEDDQFTSTINESSQVNSYENGIF